MNFRSFLITKLILICIYDSKGSISLSALNEPVDYVDEILINNINFSSYDNKTGLKYCEGQIQRAADYLNDYKIGWNTSTYIGLLDSNKEFLITVGNDGKDNYASRLKISFNFLLINPISPFTLSVENFEIYYKTDWQLVALSGFEFKGNLS